MNKVAVTSDCPSSSHQTALAPQCEVGESTRTFVELSYPPTPLALDICENLACKLAGCHVDLSPQPPSPHSVDPPDCTILCSSVPDSTLVVIEDQVVDRVGFVKQIRTIINDECVWESKEEPMVKDDSLPSVPHPLYLDIYFDYATFDFLGENSSLDVSTFDHSHETMDVSLSLHCRYDTYSSENPSDLSSVISESIEGEHPCFSSTPLHDLSNHEDVDKHPEFFDNGCHDLSTSSFHHDVDSLIVNLPKPLVFGDLSIDEMEISYVVKAHHLELMFMLGPHCLEVSSTSDQNFF